MPAFQLVLMVQKFYLNTFYTNTGGCKFPVFFPPVILTLKRKIIVKQYIAKCLQGLGLLTNTSNPQLVNIESDFHAISIGKPCFTMLFSIIKNPILLV